MERPIVAEGGERPSLTLEIAGMGTREAEARVRKLLAIISDPEEPFVNPNRWCAARISLGRLLDQESCVILGPTVLHNLGKKKRAQLLQFRSEWDSIESETDP